MQDESVFNGSNNNRNNLFIDSKLSLHGGELTVSDSHQKDSFYMSCNMSLQYYTYNYKTVQAWTISFFERLQLDNSGF